MYLWFLARAAGVDLSALGRFRRPIPVLIGAEEKCHRTDVDKIGALDSPGAGPALAIIMKQLGTMGLLTSNPSTLYFRNAEGYTGQVYNQSC